MVLGYSSMFPPDASERALPDVASARELVGQFKPTLIACVGQRRDLLLAEFGAEHAAQIDRAVDAFLLGLARLGLRHGTFGEDFHNYHNEGHVLELADRRLSRFEAVLGLSAIPLTDWLMLGLFAACHDLRQRETADIPGPIGGNEAASVAETLRILDICGFDRTRDRARYVELEIMIAGSTFGLRDSTPSNSAEAVIGGGALARYLPGWLDQSVPDWRSDPLIEHALILGRMAADLDTANAGEPFHELADSAQRLCREREMREGRALDSAESAQPCLHFMSNGQERYFFELHHFASREGERVFGPTKTANAPRVRAVSAALRARFSGSPPVDGNAVLKAYQQLSA